MSEQSRANAFAQMRGGGAHRLDLALAGPKRLQRATAEQLVTFPGGPEADLRRGEPVEIERVHALRRRKLRHAPQVQAQQFDHFGTVEPAFA
jgi:hypothetical protein